MHVFTSTTLIEDLAAPISRYKCFKGLMSELAGESVVQYTLQSSQPGKAREYSWLERFMGRGNSALPFLVSYSTFLTQQSHFFYTIRYQHRWELRI